MMSANGGCDAVLAAALDFAAVFGLLLAGFFDFVWAADMLRTQGEGRGLNTCVRGDGAGEDHSLPSAI